jgi:PAS domain S-box-containing protein/putative nucleotidyltransferase with HDIG domain
MNEKKKPSKKLPRPGSKPMAPPARKRRASEGLHETETLYRALAEASPDMIFIIGRDDRVEFVNRIAAESLGRKPEDLTGRPRAQFFPSGPSQRQGERISDVFESGKPLFIENYTPFKGRDIWLHTWLVPLKNEAGEVTSVLGISRDITERKAMELSLKESEEKYRTLVERANDGILILQDGVVQYTNPRLGLSSGYATGEIQGKRFTQFIHPTEVPNVIDRYRRRLAGEDVPAIYETILLRKDGSKLPVEINAGVISFRGKPADLVIVRDITERKWAEEKVLESELQHRTTLDSMGDAIHVVDRDLRLVLLNERFKQWCRDLGLETEVIGRTVFEAFPFLPETVREEYERVFRTGETLVTEEASQVGEREIITETRKIPILQGGEVAQVVTVVHDITKRKRAEEDIQKNLRKLRQALWETIQAIALIIETKDPYTAGHQRRSTQLAEAISRELGLPEEQREGIRMAGFIHDLGKIAVPSEILSKPSPLNEIERAIIQNHVRAGYEILKTVEFPWPVAEIVLQHHEKLDGSGYPKGLKGDSILIEAKILAVADVVEAMASYRPYRPALGVDQALEEIVRYKGARFEPRVVDACLKLFSEKGFSFEPKEEKG